MRRAHHFHKRFCVCCCFAIIVIPIMFGCADDNSSQVGEPDKTVETNISPVESHAEESIIPSDELSEGDSVYPFESEFEDDIISFVCNEVETQNYENNDVIDFEIIQAQIDYEEMNRRITAFYNADSAGWSELEFRRHFAVVAMTVKVEYSPNIENICEIVLEGISGCYKYQITQYYYLIESEGMEWYFADTHMIELIPIM